MIRTPKRKKEFVIDLMGQQGNAFWLLAYAKDFCKQLQLTDEHTKLIHDEMTSGNYNHLVAVFERNFGSFVTLEADKSLMDEITAEVKKIDEEESQRESLLNWIDKV